MTDDIKIKETQIKNMIIIMLGNIFSFAFSIIVALAFRNSQASLLHDNISLLEFYSSNFGVPFAIVSIISVLFFCVGLFHSVRYYIEKKNAV